ncbi:MAG: hypothetical protein PUD93_07645 [Lachnospiraceae bacterium]|nr:hypothetical protein [Lachnospiraceae bacterium]
MGREWDDTLDKENMSEQEPEKNNIEETDGKETDRKETVMEQLEEKQTKLLKKQLFYSRVTAFSALGFLVAVVIALVIVVPKAVITLTEINQAVELAETTLSNADTALADISEISTNVTTVSIEMENFLLDNSETVTSAMEDISSIDFEGLNNAIQDLEDVVEPFANMMNRFK